MHSRWGILRSLMLHETPVSQMWTRACLDMCMFSLARKLLVLVPGQKTSYHIFHMVVFYVFVDSMKDALQNYDNIYVTESGESQKNRNLMYISNQPSVNLSATCCSKIYSDKVNQLITKIIWLLVFFCGIQPF